MKTITERHVQAIWYDAALRPTVLTTRRGSEVHVIHPGEWNLGPGPDFTAALLEIGKERRRVVGDIEIHLCPGDWDLHGHGSDPRYRNVIAHVTWGCGPDPSSLPPGAVSIWLGRLKTADPLFSPDEIDLLAYPYAKSTGARPCEVGVGRDPDVAFRILSEAGRHRLEMKARRLLGRLAESGAQNGDERQIFYEETMTALGYSRNAVQFRHVAERIPHAEIPADAEAAKTMLLVAGGFEEWDRTAVRPNNSPERRLANAALVFSATPIMRMAEVRDFSRASCRQMVRLMCGERYMGRGRAAAVVANVVAPFALATGRLAAVPDWLPPEDISEPVRLTAYRMFGRDHNPAAFYATNGLLIQGLLQIHRDFCRRIHPDCGRCGLTRRVSGGKSCE